MSLEVAISSTNPADRIRHTINSLAPNMPARAVHTRSRERVTGQLASLKMEKPIPWESFLEFDFLKLCEVDPRIKGIIGQPLTLFLKIGAKRRKWTPDFRLVPYSGRPRLVEVKFDRFLSDEDAELRINAMHDAAASVNCNFELALASEIRREPRLTNAKLLLTARRHQVSHDVRYRILSVLSSHPRSLADLSTEFSGIALRADLYRLCLEGLLSIDMDIGLSENTIFHVGGI